MTFGEFQKGTMHTINVVLTQEQRLAMLALGLAGEAGEVVDILKKYLFHAHPLDLPAVAEEMGDVLYYLAALAETMGLSLEQISIDNRRKLMERYPEGFDAERSRSRGQG